MKKALSLIMALVLCLGLCACADNRTEPGSQTELGSQFVGTYNKSTRTLSEYYSGWGYDNLVNYIDYTSTLTLNGGGTGTFKATTIEAGKYWQVGDVIEEGTVQWTCEDDYITITYSGFSYSKSYGKNTTTPIDYTVTYEKKAGTLHDVSSGNLVYTKVG